MGRRESVVAVICLRGLGLRSCGVEICDTGLRDGVEVWLVVVGDPRSGRAGAVALLVVAYVHKLAGLLIIHHCAIGFSLSENHSVERMV